MISQERTAQALDVTPEKAENKQARRHRPASIDWMFSSLSSWLCFFLLTRTRPRDRLPMIVWIGPRSFIHIARFARDARRHVPSFGIRPKAD